MKNIIPWTALALGILCSSNTYAEKQVKDEDLKAIAMIARLTWENVNTTLEMNDARRNETWRKNTENIAKSLLPGNPVSLNQNGYRSIGYNVAEFSNWIKLHLGAYKQDGGKTNYGFILNVPLWK